jgi:hypothetical protein
VNGVTAFGILVAFMGVAQLVMAKPYGPIAHHAWKRMGAERMAMSPEYWTRASMWFGVAFLSLALILVVSGLLLG